MAGDRFEALVAEGAAAPVEGWDFSFLEGRASEGRPSWHYAEALAARLAAARRALDIQTGGGEVLAGVAAVRGRLVATESWPPNLALAARRLQRLGAAVVGADDLDVLPFAAGAFDLVTGRHPLRTPFREIARVLGRGGTFFSQQVGAGSARELIWALMGPVPVGVQRDPDLVAEQARVAGLEIVGLRAESLPMSFSDIGAVVYFLRKVCWTVPDFSVERYRRELRELHARIVADGRFDTHSERFLIEARKPE